MKLIAITQRVELIAITQERRDTLDQRWCELLHHIGFTVLPLPNNLENAISLLKDLPIQGIILSGGNSLINYTGDAPERDELEYKLLQYAKKNKLPLLGVCRGMQIIQHQENITLHPLTGHVCHTMTITHKGKNKTVNSYHDWGAYQSSKTLDICAKSEDGVIKAVQHTHYPIHGIMWHPEREFPFSIDDLEFITRFFTP